MPTRESLIEDHGELMFLEGPGFDECIVGTQWVDGAKCVQYDGDRIITALMTEQLMSYITALEHFYKNIEPRQEPGYPVFMWEEQD